MEAATTSWRSLGELFVERGLISEADLERALAEQVATKRRLADILVRRGLVTGHDITNALMEQLGNKVPAASKPARPVPTAAGPAAAAAATAAPAPATAPPAPAPEPAEVVALPEPPRPSPAPTPAAEATPEPKPEPKKSAKKSQPEPQETVPSAPFDLSISVHALIAEADSRRRGAEAELFAAREAHAQVLRGLEQVRAELEARDLPSDGLAKELRETQARLRNREDELADQIAIWDEAKREAERCGGQVAELQARLEEKEQELSEASASAAAWAARSSEIEDETHVLAERVDTALGALEHLAATRFAANGADVSRQATPPNGPSRKRSAAQTGVLYFVPKAEGYDLVEREGELPAVGEALEFGDQQFVVTKLGRSPLPFDRRACVFLTAV
jgi:hypothetical protein